QLPLAVAPRFELFAADLFRQVHAFQARPFGGHSLQRADVELAVGTMGDDDRRRAFPSNQPGQGARVESGDADAAIVAHPAWEIRLGAEARRAGHSLADDAP